MKLRKSQRGVTSVTVSIVLSVIAIILCIALPFYVKFSHNAKYELCSLNIKNSIYPALKEYYKKHNNITYPDKKTYHDLSLDKQFPVCPLCNKPYRYIPKWNDTHQQIEDFVVFCDSDAHAFIGKKGYPKYCSEGYVEPDKDKYLDLKDEDEDKESKKDDKKTKK